MPRVRARATPVSGAASRPNRGNVRAIFRAGPHATIRQSMAFSRDQAATIARARLARGGAIAALAILLTVAFTYPIAPRLGSVGRFDTGDGHWSIWCVAWVSHALATDPADLFDANIFVPHRDTLAYSENNIVAGVFGLPAYLASGNPYATHNFSMLVGIALAVVGAYALVRYLTRDTGAAVVAAIGFAFCPFLFARTAHIQLMLFFGLPIALLAMHRLIDAPSAGRGVVLGLALAVQALACGYYGIFAGLLAALGLPFFALTRGRWREVRYWTAAAIAAVDVDRAGRPVLPALRPRPGRARLHAIGRGSGLLLGGHPGLAGLERLGPPLDPAVAGPLERSAVPRRADAAGRPVGPGLRVACGGTAPPRPRPRPTSPRRRRSVATCWRSTPSAAPSPSGSRSAPPPDSIGCCSR